MEGGHTLREKAREGRVQERVPTGDVPRKAME